MIAADEYRFLQAFLHQRSGLSLGEGKEYLIESRLSPVAVSLGFANLHALVLSLRSGPAPTVAKSVCDAMTTGETLFFRDNTPFNVFRDALLPEAVTRARAQGRPVRVWSAASSTGQEAYSLSMLVEEEERKLAGARVEILATDYSSSTVARAKQGTFNQFEVQRGLPIQYLLKYFTTVGQTYQIKDQVRRRVTFREQNLLAPFTDAGIFDVIFVRNVLIYFDQATKKDVLERLTRQLAPGGALVLGGTENTLGITDMLVREPACAASVYRRTGAVRMSSAA